MSRGAAALLSPHRFDVHEYHRMIEVGILEEGARIELIDGEIVQMHPIGSRHFACVSALNERLSAGLAGRFLVSVQGPVRLDRYSEPEPDVALLRRRDDFYASALPEAADAFLVIEVADTSLLVDRRVKLPLYAAAGIPEVWLIDLNTDTVEVYRQPEGQAYRDCTRVTTGIVAPLAAPDLQIDVRTFLPRSVPEPST